MSGDGKIAVVTGAGSGVGRGAALALAAHGWSVVIGGRREDALAETISLAGEKGGRLLAVGTDVSDDASVANLFAKTIGAHGRLDLLFNNAGGNVPSTSLEEMTPDQWRGVVDVNLTGVFLCTREAMRIMRGQAPKGGRIINNGSISAHTPRPGSAAYTATKHAVTGLTKSTALDGRKNDIACGQIDIGNASTPMTRRMESGVPQPDGSTMPEPTMDLDNVSNAVVYMASLPLDANVLFMTVMATQMPFVGRG